MKKINTIAKRIFNIVREDEDPNNSINGLLDSFELETGINLERNSRLPHTNFDDLLAEGNGDFFNFLDFFEEKVKSVGGTLTTQITSQGATENI
tara:strand:- start:510 stop:791 length:282 start_codon:yes stop_codon:yes gene_type:complete